MPPRRSGPTPRVSRDDVVDAALRIVEAEGVSRLSMRKLAAELGVAVTSIYWHIGNREALIEALIEREIADMGAIRTSGRTVEDRLVSLAHALRRRLLARPHVIGLVNERGLTPLMFLPAQAALARQFSVEGLAGADAAMAVRAIQYHVIGAVILQRWHERSPEQHPTEEDLWHQHALDAGIDPEVATHLARALGPDEVFETSTRALVRALLGP